MVRKDGWNDFKFSPLRIMFAVGLSYMAAITEAEDIKNRWQEYMEELYKKDLHDPDNSPH